MRKFGYHDASVFFTEQADDREHPGRACGANSSRRTVARNASVRRLFACCAGADVTIDLSRKSFSQPKARARYRFEAAGAGGGWPNPGTMCLYYADTAVSMAYVNLPCRPAATRGLTVVP